MSPATLPLVESAAGTEAPMLAPEQGTQDTGVAAQPNPLPADAPAPPTTPALATSNDDELTTIQNLTMDDVIDPDVLARLKERAMGHSGVRGVVDAVTKGLVRGNLNTIHPGEGNQLAAMDQQDQQDAMHTLTALEGQLNMYKKEALRQHTLRKATDDKQSRAMDQARFKQDSAIVNETMKRANVIGVSGPVPPTAEEIQKDPEAATAWANQMSQLIEGKQMRLDIVAKQVPMFETAIKAGVLDPEKVGAAWDGVLASNGVSAQEASQYWSGVRLMLVSSAAQVKKQKDAQVATRNAQTANIASMIKERGVRSERLDKAFASNNLNEATVQLRLAENQNLAIESQLNDVNMDIADAMAKGADPQLLADMKVQRAKLQQMQLDNKNLIAYGYDTFRKNFNAQQPHVAINDAATEALTDLQKALPPDAKNGGPSQVELGQAMSTGTIRDFLKKYRDDPRIKGYYQTIASRAIITQPPQSGQLVTDTVDGMRMKYGEKDKMFQTLTQPSTMPAPSPQGQPSGQPK
jgi:hypothetical protein